MKEAKRWLLAMVIALLVLGTLTEAAQAAAAGGGYQTIWVPSITLWRGDKYLVDLMNVMAAGDLEIQYFPGAPWSRGRTRCSTPSPRVP